MFAPWIVPELLGPGRSAAFSPRDGGAATLWFIGSKRDVFTNAFASIRASTDRISESVALAGPAVLGSGNVQRTLSYVWPTLNSDAPLCLSTNETSVDGLRSWSLTPAGRSQSQTVYATVGYRYATNTAPDGSYSGSVYLNGRATLASRYDANSLLLGSQTVEKPLI